MMNKMSMLALCALLVAPLAYAQSNEDASAEASYESAVSNITSLVDGSSENGGECQLLWSLQNFSRSANLSESQNATFVAFIQQVQVSIFAESSLSSIQKIYQFSAALEEFEDENVEIYDIIEYQNVSSWSILANIVKVTIQLQSEVSDSLITLSDNGSSPLFAALLSGASGSYSQYSAVQQLINGKLLVILENSTISIQEQYVLIYQAFSEFFAANVQFEAAFFQFVIPGFGSFRQFYDIALSYYQQSQISVVLSGSGSSIELLSSIHLAIESAQVSVVVKGQLTQYYNALLAYFSENVSYEARLAFLVSYTRQFGEINWGLLSYVYDISISSDFGSIFDLIFGWEFGISIGSIVPPAGPSVAPVVQVSVTPAAGLSTFSACSCACNN